MRLFIAVRFRENVIGEMVSVQKLLRQNCRNGSFARRENLHLTLAFLGEVSPDRVPELERILRACARNAARFTLRFDRLGHFPGRNGTSLWYLSSKMPPELEHLVSELHRELRAAGFPLEDRKFLPHVTLGRRCRIVPGADPAGLPFPAVRAGAETMTLMQSEQTDGMRVYTPLLEVPFSAGTRNSRPG